MVLQLISEPYSAAGSVVSSILTRAVRNTTLAEWSVLLRETLQNSVDARKDQGPVTYYSKIWEATPQQQRALRQNVLTSIPQPLRELDGQLKRDGLRLLVIADWNTHGLCGPTRADIATRERPTNYRDFFLNVGREEAKGLSGGTFGLGRGVLFDISEVGTIVVFSRTTAAGKPVARLAAMALSPAFERNAQRFTGRHWWCSFTAVNHPEPVTGRTAERLASEIGLDVIPEGQTGTAILVVAPRVPSGYSLEHVTDEMISAAQLYGWPLMVGRQGRPEVEFQFDLGDDSWEPLDPEAAGSPVRDFVTAYRHAIAREPTDQPTSWVRREITYGAGRADPVPLGVLVFRHLPALIEPQSHSELDPEDVGIGVACIALMRGPRIVVKYMPVAAHPSGARTVGVFVADGAHERAFAESEPVAHDDWIPQKLNLGPNARNPVKQALAKIREAIKADIKQSLTGEAPGGRPDGLAAAVGDLLGGMVTDTPGSGGGPVTKPGRAGGRGTARPPSNRAIVGMPQLSVESSGVRVRFRVELQRSDPGSSLLLDPEPQVIVDSGVESAADRPEGAPLPVVIGWFDADGSQFGSGSTVEAPPGVDVLWVDILQPPDTAISVVVHTAEAS